MKKTIFTLLLLIQPLLLCAQENELLFSPQGIAEIHITLADGKSIHDIQNEKATDNYLGKLKAEIVIKNSSSSTYEATELYSGKILIDGRGNTSWHRPKRPYNIDFVGDDWESENPARVLGMPSCDEWALLAFWNDRSLMRLPLASYLGQYLDGMAWTPRCRYVEVWINNDYRGLYCISEKIMRDDNRVNIKKLNAESTDLSGGYILEAAPGDGHKSKPIEIATQIRTEHDGINFIFKYPKAKNVTDPQRYWIRDHLNEFETVLRSNNYNDPVDGYRKYIDEDSFIDWTILHEMSKGCDNLFHASVFVQKDRNGKLNMSSPWDFDLSYGNSGIYTEDGNWVRTHRWFGRLYQDNRYALKYIGRYDELMPLFDKIPGILQANYNQLERAGVLIREQERFPDILSEYRNEGDGSSSPSSYKGHVRYLSEWVASRNNWVFISLGLDDEEKGVRMKEIKPVIRIMNPERMERGDSFNVQIMKSDNNNNRYTYTWNDSGGFTSSATRKISRDGKYWVKIKDQWGNVSLASDTLYVGKGWASADEITIEEERLTYSNPATDQLDIYYTGSSESRLTIRLYDLKGILKRNEERSLHAGYNHIPVNTADLRGGVYLMRISTGKGIISKKVVILD